jgi:hypothetical protein
MQGDRAHPIVAIQAGDEDSGIRLVGVDEDCFTSHASSNSPTPERYFMNVFTD